MLLNQIDGRACDLKALDVTGNKKRAPHVLRNAKALPPAHGGAPLIPIIDSDVIPSGNKRLNYAFLAQIFNHNPGFVRACLLLSPLDGCAHTYLRTQGGVVCVCVRACVRGWVRACVRVRVDGMLCNMHGRVLITGLLPLRTSTLPTFWRTARALARSVCSACG